MPKYQIFNNRNVLEPGSYTRTQAGEKKAPEAISSGKVMIIDTGAGAGFGGGSGSLGTAYQGKKAIYEFYELDDFKQWVRGGVFWDIATRIFRPSTDNSIRGCESLMFIQAKESVPAALTLEFGTEVSGSIVNGGTLVLATVAEGIGANGVIASGLLTGGFAAKVVAAGGTDSLKIQFFAGTYKGVDHNGVPYNNEDAAATTPRLVYETKPFTNFNQLKAELERSGEFQSYFVVTSATVAGTGVHDGDNDTGTTLTAFAGGTETYNTDALDEAISAMQEVDNVYFLCDKFGVEDGIDVENTKLFDAVINQGIYEKFLVIGGGKDSTERTQIADSSAAMAAYYNNPYVYVCHGDILEKNVGKPGFRRLNTLYFAATVVGRLAGNAPQDPITWKNLDIDGVVDDLKLSAREDLLKAGVIHLRDIDGEWQVNQEVNTLQLNDDMILPDGTSPEGSVMRIAAILNKTIKKRLERRFVGLSYNMSNPADVKSYLESILIDSTANNITDNLIVKSQDITVALQGTDYWITYGFTTNSPINRLFITGFMFSPSTL